MGNRKYIDFKLIEKVPNKYNIKPEDIKKIIESKDRSLAGKTLQPNGLYLVSVKYE